MNRKIKIMVIFTSCLVWIFVSLLPLSSLEAKLLEGITTTNFILKDVKGKELSLKDFRGKIVVLIFGELYQENTLKAIKDLKMILSGKQSYRKSVEVLLIISERRKTEEYLDITSGLAIPYPILLDDQRTVYAQYEIIAIPTTYVINGDGKIVASLPSYTISYYDQIDAVLGYVLGEVTQEVLESVLHPKAEITQMDRKEERLLSLADNLRNRGFYDSALDSYQKVLDANPNITETHMGIGIIYLEKKQLDKAEEEFQIVLRKKPDDPAALKGIAQVYLYRGDIDNAEDILKKVLASNYTDDDIYYVMGEIYEKKGNLKEAVHYYKMNCQKLLQKRWLR